MRVGFRRSLGVEDGFDMGSGLIDSATINICATVEEELFLWFSRR